MKLNSIERLLVNNGVRAMVQRLCEGPLLRKLGGPVQGGIVLEIGCGQGAGIEVILQQFQAAHVCAIDLDSLQIEAARKRLHTKYEGRFTLIQGDVNQLPFEDASFDAAFDFGVLHHVPDWQKAVSEVQRVLKPGGTFYFEEVTRTALESWVYRKFLEHPVENRFSEAEFLEEVLKHGMEPAGVVRVLSGDIFICAAKLRE